MTYLDPYDGRTPTRAEAIERAGSALAQVLADLDARTPLEAARLASASNGRPVEEIEAEIRADRGLPPRTSAPCSA